jgi:integrase/recombinase XerD
MRIIPEALHFTDTLTLKGKSVNTVSTYLMDLLVFYEWMEQENLSFWEVKAHLMLNFLRYCD